MNTELLIADTVRRVPDMAKDSPENNSNLLRRIIFENLEHDNRPKKFKLGDSVRKIKGSHWSGRVVGTYSTELTPEGYCVESSSETGSVQIYPASALDFNQK